ncbi:MAG TPA: hypothetical protein VFG74_01860, partial [Miltoncostaeaceae bacterium]|nr:hypothetical protein [Miltoncostaeaceae bacterium]
AWRASGGAVRVAARAGGRGAWRIAAVPGGPPAAGPTAFASPALAVRDDGSADLLWAAREGDGWTVRAAVRAGAAGRWVAAPALAPGPSAGQPRAAVAPDGGAAAAWTDAGAVVLAVRGPDGRWTAAQPLGPGAAPAVAVAAGGVVRVAWSAPSGGADIVRVGGAGTGTGSVGAAEDLAAGTGPQIAATTGASAVAWAPPGGGLAALVRDAAAPATPLARQGDVPAAMVAIGGPGRAVVTWVDREGPGSATAGMATAVPGGPWRVAVQPVGEDVEAPSAAVGPGGDVLVLTASVGRSGTGRTVLAASFDAVARPRLTGSVTGRRLGGRRVAWTVRVRNASRVPAAGVRLRIVAPSATRILPPLPPGAVRRGRAVEVRVGALGPRRARAVRLVVLPGPRATAAAPSAEARAVAVAPVALRPSAPAGLAP